MARKSTVSRELAVEVLKRLMVAIDDPAFADMSGPSLDVDCELPDVDVLVDSLLSSLDPASDSILDSAKLPEYVTGTKHVSIRIPNRVVRAFKGEASKSGMAYQTLMNRTLADAAEGFAV